MTAPAKPVGEGMWATQRYTGDSPAIKVLGGDDGDPIAVAINLTPWWRDRFRELPVGDFARPSWMKARILDSAVRRGWIEACGYHDGKAWFYRLTHFGAAIARAA